jgi:hypothetical protein
MSSKDDYTQGAGVSRELYEDPRVRMRGIFRTARAGSLSLEDAEKAWDALKPMRSVAGGSRRVKSRSDYDALVVRTALSLASSVPRINFGIGQKMVNLFMKDQWALGKLPKGLSKKLHAPLDRTVLSKLADLPDSWKSWSHVEAEKETDPEVVQYLAIQAHLRDLVATGAVPFGKVIELEQFIWQKF